MNTKAATVVFVRHGETPQHAENRYVGRTDAPLTEEGRRQAEELAGWSATAGLNAIWASPLSRARETAEPSARVTGLELRTDERLVELDFGDAEGLTGAEMRKAFPEARAAFERDPFRHPLPGGEPPTQAIARARAALENIADAVAGGTALVVAHGTLLRLLLCDLLGVDPGRYRDAFPEVHNASGAVLRFTPERGWGLIAWNPRLAADT